ncbi:MULTISPECIES: AraC family transcriptional regulator [unclassified Enterococcus]|uniref:AraC family transcriptional regulator n=1 Tax=unclassified Enterococcus TaxID=2608891 RepID=UPI0013EABD02|nr:MULTISPECIES: AraC family transcriptional regulator [unclassified Enterococcus]
MLQDLNRLIDYIEGHLTEDLSISQLAKELLISEYHLKRTFSFIAGMSLFEYIKNRRLTLANRDLLEGQKVTDVAFKYGYGSIEGFSRAFRDWSGYLPTEAVKKGMQKSFPRLTFYIDVRGGKSMEFRIEKKEPFNVVGVTKRVPIQFGGVNTAIQDLAQTITEQQRKEMHELGDLYPNQVINVSYDFEGERLEEKGSLMQMIGFATSKENPYADLEELQIEAATWAIFPNNGPFPKTLQDTWGDIYAQWLPSSDYELVEAPEISFTKWGDDFSHVYSEIWIAVKEK